MAKKTKEERATIVCISMPPGYLLAVDCERADKSRSAFVQQLVADYFQSKMTSRQEEEVA